VQTVYRGKDRGKELTDMDEEAETKAIEKWLRIVDKPLATKEEEVMAGQEANYAI